MEGHVVVVMLDPGGVAAEDQRIELGDVLVTMYGQHLRQNASQIHSLRAQHDGQPVPVGVVKARLEDGSVYRPLQSILRHHGAGHLLPMLDHSNSVHSDPNSCNHSFFLDNPWCQLVYIGQCDVGSDGGVHLINQSIMHVLMRQSTTYKPTPVSMELAILT
ncbi:unnamed protein product [Echinostoma caproni]|uniref:PDZ domain-containing protein n=1 Tax=Echinostoma caproni TaxID=27848 RepID=A0A183B5G4_9TREM|nr:unnamed protein product [Echinostoma caproni]